MKKKYIVGILISIIFLYYAFKQANLKQFIKSIEDAQYVYLIPATILVIIIFIFRAYRWKLLISPIKNIRFAKLFSALMIGTMANNILPFRIGEIVRAFVIGRSGAVSRSASFATIVVERVIDVFTILIIATIVLFFYKIPENTLQIPLRQIGLVVFLFIILFFIITVFLIKKTTQTLEVIKKLLRPIPEKYSNKIIHIGESFIEGLKVVKKKEYYLAISLISLIVWFLFVLEAYILFYSFDLPSRYNIPVMASFIIVILVTFAIMIPSSPGFIGTFHLICQQGLVLFNVPQSTALAYAVLLHAFSYLPTTLIGLIYLGKENFTFSQIKMEKMEL